MIDLSIIIVSTNEKHFLIPCLESIFRETQELVVEVIVIDNASTDGTSAWLGSEYPNVVVVRNERNLGFAASNNRGLPLARGRHVLLLNPDTEILGKTLGQVVRYMDNETNVGILGCKLLSKSGHVQASVRGFPSCWNLFFEASFLYLLFPHSKFVGDYYMSYFSYDRTREVDWLCGAFFLIRRELIDRIGILDEQFFMYAEELDYCFRAWRAGFSVVFFSEAAAIHHWGIGTTNPELVYWGHWSQILFFRKHGQGFRRSMLIWLKMMGLFLRVIMYHLRGWATRDRALLLKASLNTDAFRRILSKML